MKNKSLKKNYFFNLTYQIVSIIVPIIIMPYISRVLGANEIGTYSYVNSITSYFVLVACLGTTTYGIRTIGAYQNDVENRSRTFFEVLILRFLTTIITLIVFFVGGYYFFGENRVIYIIMALNIVNVLVDVSWFLQGMEEFKKTALISILFKIIDVVLVLFFVKAPDDLYKYVLITMGLICLSNLSMWIYIPKYVIKVKGIKPFRDFKSIIQLFIPAVATQIYSMIDRPMIKWLYSNEGYAEVGYYEQSEKIAKTAVTVIGALTTIMLPYISNNLAEGKNDVVVESMHKSYRIVWALTIPMTLGIISVSNIFIPVFFGEGYEKCIPLLITFSLIIPFIGFNSVTNSQYLISAKRQNVIIVICFTAAIINVCLNAILIPHIGAMGACIASVIAEFVVMVLGFVYIYKNKCYSLKPILNSSYKYLISGAIMFVCISFVNLFLETNVISLIGLIVLGVFVYGISLIVFKDDFVIIALRQFASKFLRKK